MRARKAIRLLSTLAIIPLSIGAAQVSSTGSPAVDPHAVTVTFFVEDKTGNPVGTLQPSDLSVLDNRKPPLRVVSFGSAKELPLRLGVLLNTNPYPEEWAPPKARPQSLAPIVKAAVDFINQMLTGPDDKAFIATYATIRDGTKFVGRDQGRHIDLNQFLKADGPDFLGFHDAVIVACAKVFGANPTPRERRILVVMPGGSGQVGQDLADYSQTVSAAQQAGVKVFVLANNGIRFLHSGMMKDDTDDIDRGRLASETGGAYVLASDFRQPPVGMPDLPQWLESIKSKSDSMYSLTYIPAEPYQSGQLRGFDLKITTNKSWKVHAPKRYLSASAQ